MSHHHDLARTAQSLADLMDLSAEIGLAPIVKDEVLLVGTAGEPPRRVGGSIAEAVPRLRALIGEANVAQLDGLSH